MRRRPSVCGWLLIGLRAMEISTRLAVDSVFARFLRASQVRGKLSLRDSRSIVGGFVRFS